MALQIFSLLPPNHFTNRFANQHISGNVLGFHHPISFWQLASLLGEEHIWDDVLTAALKIMHAKFTIQQDSNQSPYLLFSPTFYQCLQHYYHLQLYSGKLLLLHSCLADPTCLGFGFIASSANHYTAYWYNKAEARLWCCDSMHLPPEESILDMIQWFVHDLLGCVVPGSVYEVFWEHQESGSGSCGIAALNFFESKLFPNSHVQWDGTISTSHKL
jgi:hypothetical protein